MGKSYAGVGSVRHGVEQVMLASRFCAILKPALPPIADTSNELRSLAHRRCTSAVQLHPEVPSMRAHEIVPGLLVISK